jgi:hypothetical protein
MTFDPEFLLLSRTSATIGFVCGENKTPAMLPPQSRGMQVVPNFIGTPPTETSRIRVTTLHRERADLWNPLNLAPRIDGKTDLIAFSGTPTFN